MSRPKRKPEDQLTDLLQTYADAEWDDALFREIFGLNRCFKCGSVDFKETHDEDGNLVLCCSDCPEPDEHH